MNKLALRQHYLNQRRALLPEDVAYQSGLIANRLFNDVLGTSSPGILHTFLPITRRNEVDTWPIIHRIWQDFPSIQVAVSVTDIASNKLTHYVLAPDVSLVENRWGIPEPEPARNVAIRSDQVDLVLVPLLAFDRLGHRVGYGKGYYDRFLATCRPDCRKVGVSLFEPTDRIDHTEPTDVKLDACVIPTRTYLFAN